MMEEWIEFVTKDVHILQKKRQDQKNFIKQVKVLVGLSEAECRCEA